MLRVVRSWLEYMASLLFSTVGTVLVGVVAKETEMAKAPLTMTLVVTERYAPGPSCTGVGVPVKMLVGISLGAVPLGVSMMCIISLGEPVFVDLLQMNVLGGGGG